MCRRAQQGRLGETVMYLQSPVTCQGMAMMSHRVKEMALTAGCIRSMRRRTDLSIEVTCN